MFLIVKKFGIQNTSFKRLKTRGIFNRLQSEDLPHKSGIKTGQIQQPLSRCLSEDLPHKSGIKTKTHEDGFYHLLSEDLPHKSGIKTLVRTFSCYYRSEDLPHKSGIKTEFPMISLTSLCCRKTCPTNRGLRLVCQKQIMREVRSEDLPHKSGIKTLPTGSAIACSGVGRLAPQIGD